jgi:hypothetical protein
MKLTGKVSYNESESVHTVKVKVKVIMHHTMKVQLEVIIQWR